MLKTVVTSSFVIGSMLMANKAGEGQRTATNRYGFAETPRSIQDRASHMARKIAPMRSASCTHPADATADSIPAIYLPGVQALNTSVHANLLTVGQKIALVKEAMKEGGSSGFGPHPKSHLIYIDGTFILIAPPAPPAPPAV